MRLRIAPLGLLALASLAVTAFAAKATDPFKNEFERHLGVGKRAVVRAPLPASSAEREAGYRYPYFSVDVKRDGLEKAGTWGEQFQDGEIAPGTEVTITKIVYKGNRVELTFRTVERQDAEVTTFEEKEIYTVASPCPTYTKTGSPAPYPSASPLYKREVKVVPGARVARRVPLATEAKFYYPWKERDLVAADVPEVLRFLSPFLEPEG
ncbi:MAG TPA: hypothetical protein VFM29_08060 [Vicinamibacteria bacterium]|nr:hypothetical protein [Vicinamibacteria bacterium]